MIIIADVAALSQGDMPAKCLEESGCERDGLRNWEEHDTVTAMCSAAAPGVAFPAERLGCCQGIWNHDKYWRARGEKEGQGRGAPSCLLVRACCLVSFKAVGVT